MCISYNFKLCNNFEKYGIKKAIFGNKNTLYICKTKVRQRENKQKKIKRLRT